MAGLPTTNDPNNPGDPNALDTIVVIRSQGTTAQNWAGPAMAAANSSMANASAVALPGNPKPVDSRAGYLGAGQPEGAASKDIVQAYTGANLILAGANAGTAGGGGIYPNITGAAPVPNPFIKAAWSAQTVANEDLSNIKVGVLPSYTAVHSANTNNIFTPNLSGGTGPYTVTCVEYLLNGVYQSASMPATLTLTAATGAVANSVTSAAGTYQLGFRVVDSENPANDATYTVTIVLT